MKKNNNDLIMLNIINVYNEDNRSLEELKLIFNKKFLNMVYNLEKKNLYKLKKDIDNNN